MKQVTDYNSKANRTSFTPRKKIKIVRVKDNVTFTVVGYKKASKLTNVSIRMIGKNINCDDKITKGYKFYEW